MSVEPRRSSIGDDGVILDARRRRNILTAMCIGLMAVMASMTGLNVAQTDLAVELELSQSTILWIINAYTLALASLLMPIGAIGDKWGRKPILLIGLTLMLLASIAAGFAESGTAMIAARAVAGIGAAMIMPVTLSVITSSFPEEERGHAIGIWAGVAGSGAMVGLVVSAFLVDYFDWRWVFALPAALVVISFALSWISVPNSREVGSHPFDVVGSISSFLAIGGLVLGIHEGPEAGWSDPLTIAGLAVGFLALIVFIGWELRTPHPLLDVRVFANRLLATGALSLALLFGVMFGIFLVLFPFFQAVVGFSALRSAAAMLPMAALIMPLSIVAPRFSRKIGTRTMVLIGMAFVGIGLVAMAIMASTEGGYLSVLPGLLLIGVGMGFTMTPSTEAITSGLPKEKQGVASALNDTVRELGGAIGVALLGSFLNAEYRASVAPATAGLPAEAAHVVEEGIGGALLVSSMIPGEAGAALAIAAKEAFVDGWIYSMWVGVVVVALGFLYVLFRGARPEDDIAEG